MYRLFEIVKRVGTKSLNFSLYFVDQHKFVVFVVSFICFFTFECNYD